MPRPNSKDGKKPGRSPPIRPPDAPTARIGMRLARESEREFYSDLALFVSRAAPLHKLSPVEVAQVMGVYLGRMLGGETDPAIRKQFCVTMAAIMLQNADAMATGDLANLVAGNA